MSAPRLPAPKRIQRPAYTTRRQPDGALNSLSCPIMTDSCEPDKWEKMKCGTDDLQCGDRKAFIQTSATGAAREEGSCPVFKFERAHVTAQPVSERLPLATLALPFLPE